MHGPAPDAGSPRLAGLRWGNSQLGMRRNIILALVILGGGLAVWSVSDRLIPKQASITQPSMLETNPVPLIAETIDGPVEISIEIADDDHEREIGLMFREDLPDRHGMLFVFAVTGPVGFWMKNTPLALDLVFIGEDGRVGAVRRGEPQSLEVIAPGGPVRFVLELEAGVAGALKIVPGTLLLHPAIQAVRG